MKKIHAMTALGAALVFGCSGKPIDLLAQPEVVDQGAPPAPVPNDAAYSVLPPGEEDYFAHTIEGDMPAYDNAPQQVDSSGVTLKHAYSLEMGWAVTSDLIGGGEFDGVQIPHICTDGRCNNGTQGIFSFSDSHLEGQCGIFGISLADGVGLNVPDNSFKACIFPQGRISNNVPNKRTWTYSIDTRQCATGPATTAIVNGARLAFAAASSGTGFVFTETTNINAGNVKVYCNDGTTESSLLDNGTGGSAIAFAYPAGPLKFAVSAPGALEENCEGTQPVEVTRLPQQHAGYPVYEGLVDGIWTYNQIHISMNRFNFSNAIGHCGGTTQAQKDGMGQWLIMHELGHGLGFQHQFGDTGSSTGSFPASTNIMTPHFSCQIASPSLRYRFNMQTALSDLDLPKATAPVEVFDEDLSCYEPTPNNN